LDYALAPGDSTDALPQCECSDENPHSEVTFCNDLVFKTLSELSEGWESLSNGMMFRLQSLRELNWLYIVDDEGGSKHFGSLHHWSNSA